MPGSLFLISAPSGTGKTSLVQALLQTNNHLKVSISHTTRPIRNGETDKKDYFFISDPAFQQLVTENAFLEYAKVFGYFYGTTHAWVEQELSQNTDILLEIDWQGARQIKEKHPDCTSVFLLPPSLSDLENRLISRGRDSLTVIQQRMDKAREEISHYREYDYVIINENFSETLEKMTLILKAQQLKKEIETPHYQSVIQNLLAFDKKTL